MTGKETSPRPFLPEKMALRLVAVYALVGGLWILFSDRLLALLTAAPEAVTRLQTVKGWGYVVITALLLYFLLLQTLKKLRQHTDELQKASRALRLISNCNQLLLRETDEEQLLDGVCQQIVDQGGYLLAWVGMHEEGSPTIRPVGQAARDPKVSEAISRHLEASTQKLDAIHTALRTGEPVITQRTAEPPIPFTPSEAPTASIALPLMVRGKPEGILNICTADAQAFDAEEVALLQELASDLAYGLDVLRTRSQLIKTLESQRQERDLIAQITETSPIGITRVNTKGEITFANPRAESVLGLKKEQISQLTYNAPEWKITDYAGHPFPHEELPFRKVMELDRPVHDVHHAIMWPDGKRVLLSINGAPLHDAAGAISGAIFTVQDVTEQVQMAEALRESEERYRLFVENFQGIAYQADPLAFKPFFFHGQVEAITGYTAEDFVSGRVRWDQLIHPDDLAYVIQEEENMEATSDYTADKEYRIRRKDGALRWVRDIAVHFTGPSGTTYTQGTLYDVTNRKNAEIESERLLSQIQNEARRIQQLLDTVPEGVILLDAAKNVRQVNRLGQGDLNTLAPGWDSSPIHHLGNRFLDELLTSPPRGLWHEVETPGRAFQVIARPFEFSAEPEGWVLVIRNITLQREAEQREQQQERLATVGQLAAGIAHDFNNIMAVIVLYTQMLNSISDLDERAHRHLATIAKQAQAATDLIVQILDFSRSTSLERHPLNLVPLVKEAVKLWERTLPENIELKMDYAENDLTIDGEPTRLNQMLTNLALNARDAMPEGGTLHLALDRMEITSKTAPLPELTPGHWIRLRVMDTGTGIPTEALPHIFDPFFTTKERGKGSGLGLAQVYGIVEAHEGHIAVETEPGKGATFAIYFPAVEEAVPMKNEAVSTLPQGKGEFILIVEDNPALRIALIDNLAALNYRPLGASNGREALALIEEQGIGGEEGIALVLSDLVMPEMGGMALLYAIHDRAWPVGVILLTGHPLNEDLTNLSFEELVGWQLKPIELSTLAEVIMQGLATSRERFAPSA